MLINTCLIVKQIKKVKIGVTKKYSNIIYKIIKPLRGTIVSNYLRDSERLLPMCIPGDHSNPSSHFTPLTNGVWAGGPPRTGQE